MTQKEVDSIDRVRSKYKHNRTFYSDGHRLVVKEKPTAAHSRTAYYIQARLSDAILGQLVAPTDGVEDDEIITPINDECKKPPLTRSNSVDIKLPRFCGEPDGGLLWPGEDLPFAVLEVGYSDTGRKTRGRSYHWLTRGAGSVFPSFSNLVMFQIRLAISVKIKATNQALQSIEVDSYKWSNQPFDGLATRTTLHDRALHIERLVSLLFAL